MQTTPADKSTSDKLIEIHKAVATILARASNVEGAAVDLLRAIATAGPWCYGAIWRPDQSGEHLRCVGTWTEGGPRVEAFAAESKALRLKAGEGLPGRVWQQVAPCWIGDLSRDDNFVRARKAQVAGLRSAVAVPVSILGVPRAVLELMAPTLTTQTPLELALLVDAGTYLSLFLERQISEGERRASDLLKGSILEAALDAIISMDRDGRIMEFNPAAERIFGYSRATMIGSRLVDKIIPYPLRAAHTAGMARYLQTGERRIMGQRIETTAMRAGEVTFPVELTVVATNAADGEPIFTAYVRDITDRRRQEEELRRHADDLELQHRQKDAFVATLAHELRNPLAPIHSAVHVLKATVDSNPALQKMVAIIERQSQTLARLVDDLLDMSRISRGSIELQLEEVSIGEIAAEAMEVSAPAILAAGHELRTSIADSGQTFLADRVRVVQILGNLLNNAAKYTPSGGRIEFSSGAMEHEVEFRVVDTGIGISADEIPKLFEMFVQGDSVDGRVPAGLGIGLTLAAALARLHGGTVSATSAGKGKGAEFIVRLPVQAANV